MSKAAHTSSIDRLSTLPLYRQVEQHIESIIERDALGPSDPIPSTNVLARELGINHLTVRRAIGELSQRNIVVSRQGRGTFVAARPVRKVLWVCSLDVFSCDISSFYTDQLRVSTDTVKALGMEIEAVWLPREHRDESQKYISASMAGDYHGFIFCSVRNGHPLLGHASAVGLPFVRTGFSSTPGMACVTYDLQSADRLALRHLAERGHQSISFLGFDCRVSPWLLHIGEDFGLKLRFHGSGTESDGEGRQSAVESRAFTETEDLLRTGELADAIYISDEIIARGATRAMLLHDGSQKQRDVVMRCAEQDIIPLGIPVTSVVFDLVDLSQQAVRLLMDQINGVQGNPEHYTCTYRIMQSASGRTSVKEAAVPVARAAAAV